MNTPAQAPAEPSHSSWRSYLLEAKCEFLRMMRERELNGPFTDFQDFCRRIDGMEINKRAVENLIRAGAFDSTGAKRAQLIAVYEKVMDGIAEGNRVNVEGQIDFFGMGAETARQAALVLPDIPEFTPQELMAMEKATKPSISSHQPLKNTEMARGLT